MTRPPRRAERTDALARDDDHPNTPPAPSTTRSFDAAKASHALLPRALRRRALVVDCDTDRDSYASDQPVRLRVTVRNRFPLPLQLRTTAPVPWTWSVDGVDRASELDSLPDETGTLRLARRETKTFEAVWYQRIRVAADEWVAVAPGAHTIGVRLLVADPTDRLAATTAVHIE
ncbi:hypothetical protein [Haloplanus aerogenes]|uniref:DUF7974 domain-containing protein n=1 Tax=Haloplanus aerogenes TaxID=660522 RepID=A0A3M0DQC3_9EURY|nr:hypothetical protein [Haloplanus aerogenes]AZH24401.1 hypothetical protein DU502_02965 [Haloplanus aerogenes]RMB23958.1 hypothetical protein ATH50_1190 [Haloplanus aerogenes]